MCETCGCSIPPRSHDHDGHEHNDDDAPSGRTIDVQQNILARNDTYAAANRQQLAKLNTVAFNLISSPGAGKTTLLEATIEKLAGAPPVAVIEGDLQTDRDAARIRNTGAPVHQINTGEGCHLDAHMVGHAMGHVALSEGGVLFIENVGNLICPASFDLGESFRVVLLSVAEGDDKVEKYPLSFQGSHVLLISKIDLLEYVDFSVERCVDFARKLNPNIIIFELSARTGAGMDDWCAWVRSKTA